MHANKCLLSSQCKLANSDACNRTCSHYIACHGLSGTGGRVAAANVPADYRLCTVANSPARASQAQVYKAVDAYVRTFERQFDTEAERIKGLYLWSPSPGNGKSTSAAAILNAWLVTHYLGSLKRGLQPLQQPAYFYDVNEAQTLYNEFNRSHVPKDIAEKASREYYRRLQAAKSAPFAVYDDIGVRTATEGFRGDLHSAINHRTTNGMPTVYTSNLPIRYAGKEPKVEAFKPYDLVDVFGEERLADRISDMCLTLTFAGESKRGMRR